MAGPTPTGDYTVAQAARLMGRSERLIRRLAESGELTVTGESPLRVSAESVHRARDRREDLPPPAKRRAATKPLDPDEVAKLVAATVSDSVAKAVSEVMANALPRALESRDKSEQLLRDELARARAELEQLRQQQQRRKWFRQ